MLALGHMGATLDRFVKNCSRIKDIYPIMPKQFFFLVIVPILPENLMMICVVVVELYHLSITFGSLGVNKQMNNIILQSNKITRKQNE